MSYEILVALEIKDNTTYNSYREAMKPILVSLGGEIVYDFKVSEVLKSPSEGELNRVFTLNFPSKENMDKFFSDEEYQVIKEKYFNKSVGNMQIISAYEK